MPSETPMTASLMLLALGLKLRRRSTSDICWLGWEAWVGEDVVMSACGGSVWDSSSMLGEGSMVVAEVLVVLVL